MVLNTIRKKTKQTMTEWKDVYGFAPNEVAEVLEEVRLDWIIQLTDCLELWVKEEKDLSEGELLLARANLGAIVEGWLKFFYCIHYEDYEKNPVKNKEKVIHPRNLKFERLKQFSRGILWDKGSDWDSWIDGVQTKRNAIHAFNNKEIGTSDDFLKDIDRLEEFIDIICQRLPDIMNHPKYQI